MYNDGCKFEVLHKVTPNLKVAIPTATPNLDRNVEMKSILTYSEQGRIGTRSWL